MHKEEKMGVLKQMEKKASLLVTEPTSWINSMVVTEKPGKLCICIDASNLS